MASECPGVFDLDFVPWSKQLLKHQSTDQQSFHNLTLLRGGVFSESACFHKNRVPHHTMYIYYCQSMYLIAALTVSSVVFFVEGTCNESAVYILNFGICYGHNMYNIGLTDCCQSGWKYPWCYLHLLIPHPTRRYRIHSLPCH